MASVFDGIAGVLTGVFGAPVTYLPQVGAPRSVASIFRREPVEVLGADGRPVLITAATWRVQRDLVAAVPGDRIIAPDGIEYRIVNDALTSGSPAADAFVIYELERAE